MKHTAKALAHSAITAALCVVLMLLGGILELGIYAAPLLAGLCFLPIGSRFGKRWHICVFIASSLLCLLFVPNIEENVMFLAIFGWYPIVHPMLQKLPPVIRWICKLGIFNTAVIAAQWLVLTLLAPQALGTMLLWVLLALGNVTFVLYDLLIPKMQLLLRKIFH